MVFRVWALSIECWDGYMVQSNLTPLYHHNGACPLCSGFGNVSLVLPHVIDRAGAFTYVQAGGESAR